ncbi:MAG TPA: 3-hydroxyacyl-CoA dehydrogenase family protein [Chitinophagaceae bacterium]
MRIAVSADDTQKNEILGKGVNEGVEIIWLSNLHQNINADVCFDLLFNEADISKNNFIRGTLVFANSVITASSELPSNYIRINAWNGFLQRELIEIATATENIKEKAASLVNTLGWKFIWAPDIPGMITARVISMIINEAYFALGDNISTKEEIDIAMKLGTNYPYGPFEWGEKIGLRRIYSLLKKLNEKDRRYDIAPLLNEEVMQEAEIRTTNDKL